MRLCQRHGRIVPGHSNPTKKEFMSDQTTEQSSQQAAAAPDAAQRPNVDVSMFGPIPGDVVAAMLAGAASVARAKVCGEGCDDRHDALYRRLVRTCRIRLSHHPVTVLLFKNGRRFSRGE